MRKLLLLGLIIYLSGCSTAQLAIIKPVTNLPPHNIQNNQSREVAVTKIVVDIKPNSIIGRKNIGIFCTAGPALTWAGMEEFIKYYPTILIDKLSENGYKINKKPSSLFESDVPDNAELLIGGRIMEISSNICYAPKGQKGEAYMKIKWEIYERKSKAVLLTMSTDGGSKITEFTPAGVTKLFNQTVGIAADNLLANEKFYSLFIIE